MNTYYIKVKTVGKMFITVKVYKIGSVQLIPSYVITPKNRALFKKFVKYDTQTVRINNVSYYVMDNRITKEML